MNCKKTLNLLLIAVLLFGLFGCSIEQNSNISSENNNFEERESKYGVIYKLALDSSIGLDSALNHEMQYIAIDTQSLTGAVDKDIVSIMEYFKKYDVNVIDESKKSLKEKGMVKDHGVIDGILLTVEKIDIISENKIIVESSKYRSGTGAIGVKSIIIKNNGQWELESSNITWIS